MSKCNHVIALGFYFLLSSAFADVELLSKTSLGEQQTEVLTSANISGTSDILIASADAFYTGLINNHNADTLDRVLEISDQQASFNFKAENTGDIELYQVKTYHDLVSPVDSGWSLQCNIAVLKPGQVRYCKRDIIHTETGLNHAMGRAQGRNAIISANSVINAAAPTFFIVP